MLTSRKRKFHATEKKNCSQIPSIFSSPEPKSLVNYCYSTPSVVCPSVSFSYFQLLKNRLMDIDETW